MGSLRTRADAIRRFASASFWSGTLLVLAAIATLVAVPPPASAASRPSSAPILAVGVQDSWINDCDTGSTPRLPHPGSATPAVDSPYWTGLHVDTVRYSPPWDIAYHNDTSPDGKALAVEQACFDYWLRALAVHGVAPEIAFKPDYNYQSHGRIMVPTLRTYEAAIGAFIERYSNCPGSADKCADGTARIRIISPWGEPEFTGKGKAGTVHRLPQVFYLQDGSRFDATTCPAHATDANCGPALAAQMWVTVRHRCSSCTVIAGDFGSNQTKDFAYLAVYRAYLRDLHGGRTVYHPDVWAIHPYTDVIGFERAIVHHQPLTAPQDSLVGRFARRLQDYGYGGHTHIWLDEVSSFTVDFSGQHYSTAVQAQAAHDLLTYLPRAGGTSVAGQPVVTRIYYMRYAGAPQDSLIINGIRRPIYWTIANRHE